MAVEEAHLLVLLPPHVVHTLVGLHVSDLRGGGETSRQAECDQTTFKAYRDLCVTFHLVVDCLGDDSVQ